MKLIDILLEDTIEENIFKKIGSFLKSAFNKFVGTLKKVMNKLPLGKSTTITITIPIPLQEDAFGSLAGTYVEHATAYHLANLLKEAKLTVENDIAKLQQNMESSYERMVDAATKSQQTQVKEKELAGTELGKAIKQGLASQLEELKNLEDAAVVSFYIKQVGSTATQEGSKSDLDLIVKKDSIESIMKRYSLKATINTTDSTGVEAILRLTAKLFAPELLSDSGQFVAKSGVSQIKGKYPEVGKIFDDMISKVYGSSEDYPKHKTQQNAFIRNGRKELTAKFGQDRRDKKQEVYDYLTKEKGYKGVDPNSPGYSPIMYLLSIGGEDATAEEYKEFEVGLIDRFLNFLRKEFKNNPETKKNFLKNQLGIDEETEFYGYIAKKKGIISRHHSKAFDQAVSSWLNDGEIELKPLKRGDQGIVVTYQGVEILKYSFQMFTTLTQGYINKNLAGKT